MSDQRKTAPDDPHRTEQIEQAGVAAAAKAGETMQPRLTGSLAAALVTACSSASPHVVTPRDSDASEHGAGSQAHGHEPAGHDMGGHHHAFTDADAWTRVFDDPSRDAWQRPDEVLGALELEPTMVVADVGAGTGYFSVRLARAVPRGEVLATDLEPDMVRFLRERARREQLPNLRSVQATRTTSGLTARSVDRILIVHLWHHLAEREAYARRLALALRPGGRLFIVDFSPSADRGPPASIRVAAEAVLAELESAGLSAKVSPIAIPDQYIVEGHIAALRFDAVDNSSPKARKRP
ncbi:MAG TPA: class I SAM-dependent methyltransferase [Polyangiaceae bacterium]|nr:class I SAM-dependent methyltransferase [Polyangiaceae bacterium]